MPTAPQLDWPQGQPLFEVQWRAVSESLAGNGVVGASDLEVTATATDLEIQVAAGTVFYLATEYSIGAAETHTLSAGDGTYDRWDTVYFDTSTGSTGVREGTPAADPEPPDIQSDELLLAIVYVPQNATDVPDSSVLNWRAQFSNEAEETHYDDTTGTYGVSDVASALDELQEAAQLSAYPLASTDLATGAVTSTEIADGTIALADLANPYGLDELTDMDMDGTDLSDSAGPGVVYDASAGVVLQSVLGGPASSLSAYPLANTDLANTSVTVTAGYLLSGGGSPALGGSGVTVDYDVARVFEGQEGGNVPASDQGVVEVESLPDGETARVDKATLTLGSVQPVPTGLNLELVTFDGAGGYTTQASLITGDGSTLHDRESGDPLGSYTNTSGSAETVGVIVDNTTGADEDIYSSFQGGITT